MSVVIKVTTQEALEKLIEDWHYVVVDFSAPDWCVPCQRLAPHFERAAQLLPQAIFAEVDVDSVDSKLLEDYGIQSVPTLHLYKHGHMVGELKGRTVNALVTEIEAFAEK